MQLGPYTVQDEIARGGNGVVYRAVDPQGRVVALKLLLRSVSHEGRIRFQAEAQALARLRHPHVVQVVGAGQNEGCPWIALEFVEGETLDEVLVRGPLPVETAVAYGRQLARALSYVHACGLLHRDLKPANVLVRGDEVLLTDFGLVLDDEREGSRLTATGALQGTPGYWAPEQVAGAIRSHGPPTDVYGLAGVIYACLTGEAPGKGGSVVELVLKITDDPTPPRELRPEVPAWLDSLVQRCLARDPADRPQSADEVARELLLGSTQPPPRDTRAAWLAAFAGLFMIVGLSWAWKVWAQESTRSVFDATPPQPAPPEPPPPAPEPTPDPEPPEPEPEPEPEPRRKPTQKELHTIRSLGLEQAQAGNYEEALKIYRRAIELDPDHAETYNLLGLSLGQLGRHQEAVDAYGRAFELEPDGSYLHNIGTVFTSLGQHENAIGQYTKALEHSPELVNTYRKRAQSLYALQRFDEALADAQRATELAPDHPVGYAMVGLIQDKRGNPRESFAALSKALELDVPMPEARWVRQLHEKHRAALEGR